MKNFPYDKLLQIKLMVDVPSSIAKFVCWINIRMRLFSSSLELIYSILSLIY